MEFEWMKFTKMHGCGNDYVYIDGAAWKIPQEDKPRMVRFLSDRHFGIGGDGVIFINPAEAADFEMEMYNADGTRAEMCGNGIRCVAKYVYDKGLTDKKRISIVSAGQVKHLELTVDQEDKVSLVRVNMGSPILDPKRIPVMVPGERAVDVPIRVGGITYRMTCVSMGNPHAVVFVENVGDLKLEQTGPLFESHELFPNRTNTEFVEVVDRRHVKMRERRACVGAGHGGDLGLRYGMLRYSGGLRAEWPDRQQCNRGRVGRGNSGNLGPGRESGVYDRTCGYRI